MRHGLSVFPSYEDCAHALDAFPDIGDFVAKGLLNESHGMIAATGSSLPNHHTWWPYEGIVRSAGFEIVVGDPA